MYSSRYFGRSSASSASERDARVGATVVRSAAYFWRVSSSTSVSSNPTVSSLLPSSLKTSAKRSVAPPKSSAAFEAATSAPFAPPFLFSLFFPFFSFFPASPKSLSRFSAATCASESAIFGKFSSFSAQPTAYNNEKPRKARANAARFLRWVVILRFSLRRCDRRSKTRLVDRRFSQNETQNRKNRIIRRYDNQFFPPRPDQKNASTAVAARSRSPLSSDFAPSALFFSRRRNFEKNFRSSEKIFAVLGVKKRRNAANFEKIFARLFRVAGRIEQIDYNREDDACRRNSTPSAFPRRAFDVIPRFPRFRSASPSVDEKPFVARRDRETRREKTTNRQYNNIEKKKRICLTSDLPTERAK